MASLYDYEKYRPEMLRKTAERYTRENGELDEAGFEKSVLKNMYRAGDVEGIRKFTAMKRDQSVLDEQSRINKGKAADQRIQYFGPLAQKSLEIYQTQGPEAATAYHRTAQKIALDMGLIKPEEVEDQFDPQPAQVVADLYGKMYGTGKQGSDMPYKVGTLHEIFEGGKKYQATFNGMDASGNPVWKNKQLIPDTKPPIDEKPLTGETAGKLAMLNGAAKDVSEVEGMLFPGGKMDTSKLAYGFFGLPSETGREINSRIENAVAAKLRAETGAAATEGEVRNVSKRFKPKPGLDDEAAVRDKLTRLKNYLNEAADYIDPKGTHRALAEKNRQGRSKAAGAPKPTGGSSAMDKLRALAIKGDPKAQAYLKSKGIAWQQ